MIRNASPVTAPRNDLREKEEMATPGGKTLYMLTQKNENYYLVYKFFFSFKCWWFYLCEASITQFQKSMRDGTK